MSEATERFDKAVWPVLAAIDGAVRSGCVDLEAIREVIDGHLEWWADELAPLSEIEG